MYFAIEMEVLSVLGQKKKGHGPWGVKDQVFKF